MHCRGPALDNKRACLSECSRAQAHERTANAHMAVHERKLAAAQLLASFSGHFCRGEEKRPGHHCWCMRIVPIKTWEFMHVCTLSAYTLVISRNISVHNYECLSVLLQLCER